MEKDKLILEYTRLCLEFQSFAGSTPVDEEREDQVINRLYEIRELLGMKPINLRPKKDSTAVLKLNDDSENQFEDKCWYIEKWYDEDLEVALEEAGIPITKENVIKLKTACKGIFDDKSERNSMLCQIAEKTFR